MTFISFAVRFDIVCVRALISKSELHFYYSHRNFYFNLLRPSLPYTLFTSLFSSISCYRWESVFNDCNLCMRVCSWHVSCSLSAVFHSMCIYCQEYQFIVKKKILAEQIVYSASCIHPNIRANTKICHTVDSTLIHFRFANTHSLIHLV